jgi:hypothetical protein
MAFTLTLTSTHGCLPSPATFESEAKKYGIQFTVDGEKGTFSGRGVGGTFTLTKDSIHINVTNKPWPLPESVIKMVITKWFASRTK